MRLFTFPKYKRKDNFLVNSLKFGIWSLLVLGQPLLAKAQRVIKGLVTDVRNEPLIGVTISSIGFARGTVTDLEGKFSFEIPNQCEEIEITYTGYKNQKIALDSRVFYSVSLLPSKREKKTASNIPNNQKERKAALPLRKISRLFGVSAQIGYFQESGSHKFPIEGSLTSISDIQYGLNEFNARFSIVTPIIELSKSYTVKTISNKYTKNTKYDNVELNFDGLPLLFTKKSGSNAGGFGTLFYSMILPNFTWKKIVGDNYYQKSFSTNFLYGIMGFESEQYKINYAPISISGNTIYGGIEYNYNRYNIIKMTGIFERMPRIYYNISRLSRKMGLNEKKFDYYKENPGLKYLLFIPIPCLDLYYQTGRFTYFDNKKTPVFDKQLDTGLGVSFSIIYQPYIRIKKINAWIIPKFTWVIYDETGKVEPADTQSQISEPLFQFKHKYIRAGIGFQLML